MRGSIAQGLAALLLIASSGAAQGPASSGSANTRIPVQTTAAASQAAARKTIKPHAYQVGTASWYGDYFEGKTTASGEPFNMYDLTAAHPELPLGTFVRVTNLRNRKTVVVRINDRGPVVPGRIIDLSYSAANALHMSRGGLQRVRLDVVHPDVAQPEVVAQLTHPVAY
jgi:rare lipoprotein A